MSFNIGIGVALDGEKEFKSGIREINSELKLLQAQSKEIDARYGDNARSLEALTEKNENLVKQLEQAKNKVELSSKELATWQEVNKKAGDRVSELKGQLSDAEAEMKRMESSADTATEELDAQQKVVKDLQEKLKNAERAYETSESRVSKYQTSLVNAKTEQTKLNTALEKNKQELQEALAAVEDTENAVDEYGDEVEEASQKTSTFGDVLKANLVSELVIQGAKKIAESVKEISGAAVEVGSGFESSMSQVAATMGMTAAEIEAGSKSYEILEAAAKKSGKETKYSASQAGEALNYLALAGYDAQKAADTLPKVLSLASAGGMELAYASDLVTDSMAALGLETSQLDNYIDEMARTAQKSNTSVAQLGEATLVCAGTASLTRQSLETLNAELGVLANNGYKGAEGGTHLRNILLSLTSPTDKAKAQLEALGVSVVDSSGNVRDLNNIMIDLNDSLSDMSSSEKTQAIARIFNRTDIAAVNALLKGTGDEFDNLKGQLLDCEGAAQDMAETMEANLTGKITILQSALEALGISAYEKIEGTLKSAVDEATDSVGRLQDSMDNGRLGNSMDKFAEALDDAADNAIDFAEDALPLVIDGLSWVLENSDLVIAGIAGIAAANMQMKAVGPAVETVTAAWKTYKTANEGATVSQWLLNTAMSANPAGVLITAIVGLTAAVAAYALINDDAVSEAQKMIEANREQIDLLNAEVASRKEAADANATEISTLRSLKSQLTELNSKEKLSTEEKNKMLVIVEELNQALPDLNLTIDEQTGKLSENTEGWEANAEAQLKALELQFMQEDAEKIARERYEAEKQLAEMEAQRAQSEEKLAEITAKYNDCLENQTDGLSNCAAQYTGALSPAESYAIQIQRITEEIETQKAQEAELQQTMDGLTQEYANLTDATEAAATATEQLALQTVYFDGQFYEVTSDIVAMMGDVEKAYDDAYEEARKTIGGQVGLFQELKIESDLTAKQMADNLSTQKDSYTQYTENLTKAAQIMKEDTTGSFSAIVQSIMDMGMEGAGYLDELVNAFEEGDESFQSVIDNWTEMSEAQALLVDTLADMQSGYSEQMENILGTQTKTTESMAQDWEKRSDEYVRTVWDANHQMIADAEECMGTLENTVSEDGKKVVTAAEGVGKDTTAGVESVLEISGGESGTFRGIGSAISAGMVAGIKSGENDVIEAATQIGKSAYKAIQTELQVKSPSRKAKWLGEMFTEGWRIGALEKMENANTEIRTAMSKLAEAEVQETRSYSRSRSEASLVGADMPDVLAYLKVIAEKSGDVYIDGNTWVGKVGTKMDSEFSAIAKKKERKT